MDADSWQYWPLLAGLVLVDALLSAAEVAISSVATRSQLRQKLQDDTSATARVLLRLAENSSRLLATVRVGVTLSGFFAAASAALAIYPHVARWLTAAPFGFSQAAAAGWAFFLTILILASVMIILGELLPKVLADHYSRPVAFVVAWPIQLLSWIFRPLVWFLSGITNLVVRLLGGTRPGGLPYVREEEILTLVDAGEEGGAIEWEEKEMIDGILEMGKTLVREVMVPRTDIVAVEVQTPLLEALDAILKAGHSRLPVYQETVDYVVGLLYAKDLLTPLRDLQHERPLQELLRPVYFIPETKVVDDLLRELQGQRIHMAIVVDEYGGTAGVVTIEDLLEEIVGEIQDEYDTEEPLLQCVGGGEFVVDARLSVDDAEKMTGARIPEGDFDTIGGFIYDRLGAIPQVGDRVEVDNAVITVTSIQGVRPVKLHVQCAELSPEQPAGDEKGPVQDGSRS